MHVWCDTFSVKTSQTIGLNEDTLGGILKVSLAQYLALEISKGNGRETRFACLFIKKITIRFNIFRCRAATRYLPWLFNPPGNIATQGPREFLDCVAHIR